MTTSARHAHTQRRLIWPPEPGLFALRLIARGWQVPAEIILHADGKWQAWIDGETLAPHPDPTIAAHVATIWHSGQKIDRPEFDWLIATKAYAVLHAPDHPCLHPRKPIDPRLLTPIMAREDTTR